MKAPSQLEYRALAFLDALQAGQPGGAAGLDTAFARWPKPSFQTARLLAAHANAARGRTVLWLVGAGRHRGGKMAFPGGQRADFDVWLDALQPFFEGLSPHVRAFSLAVGGSGKEGARQVVALEIETTRAPFVVRSQAGCVDYSVPWWDHEAGVYRVAGRADLIRLLVPLQDLPQFEVLEAELTFYKNAHASGGPKITHRWTLDGSLYVIPRPDTHVVIPLHRCRAGIGIAEGSLREAANDFTLSADKQSPAVRITESAALIDGLGRMFTYCSGATGATEILWKSPLTLTFDLVPTGSDRAAIVQAQLQPAPVTESNQAGRWKL